ncbi:unnamed protein product [Allacma fusca]|uniref:Uncharacterized protein n=1 Tax=Allacma fusca TaxID=39272 RepID=A0A8J2KAN0_9HEXA|nr:unnamed protein product [Allacma fusca]
MRGKFPSFSLGFGWEIRVITGNGGLFPTSKLYSDRAGRGADPFKELKTFLEGNAVQFRSLDQVVAGSNFDGRSWGGGPQVLSFAGPSLDFNWAKVMCTSKLSSLLDQIGFQVEPRSQVNSRSIETSGQLQFLAKCTFRSRAIPGRPSASSSLVGQTSSAIPDLEIEAWTEETSARTPTAFSRRKKTNGGKSAFTSYCSKSVSMAMALFLWGEQKNLEITLLVTFRANIFPDPIIYVTIGYHTS